MRNICLIAMVVVAGCGSGVQPWDKNHDGLIGQCEGLERIVCDLTPGCEGQQLACLAVCQDDGTGGCVPCPNDFQCVPKAPVACRDLNAFQCSTDSRCEAETPQYCTLQLDDSRGGGTPCNGGAVCRDRAPVKPSCALLPINSCASFAACELQTVTVCTATSGGHPEETDPSVGCGGGCTATEVCANKQVHSCESTPVDSCTANPSCQLEDGGPVCEIFCQAGSVCPPCATKELRCVTRPALTCETRTLDQCTSQAGCMVESYACAAVCEDDGNGGCLPCPGAPSRCVPLPSPVQSPPPQPTK